MTEPVKPIVPVNPPAKSPVQNLNKPLVAAKKDVKDPTITICILGNSATVQLNELCKRLNASRLEREFRRVLKALHEMKTKEHYNQQLKSIK